MSVHEVTVSGWSVSVWSHCEGKVCPCMRSLCEDGVYQCGPTVRVKCASACGHCMRMEGPTVRVKCASA